MKNKLKFLMIFGALFALFIFLPQATQAAMEWDQVNTNGFGSSGNYNCDFIVTFNNALYVGTGNATGLRVWRSTNGSTWTQVNSNGFGDVSNMNAFGAYVFDGYLYAGTYNINGLEIWRTSNGTTWSQVVGDEVDGNGIGTDENGFGDGGNLYSIEMIEFNNYLYIGTYNNLNAAEVWRTSNGTAWSQTNTVGFDADINNLGSYPMIIFNSRLYIATSNEITGTEVWSTSNGSDWTQVNSDGFGDSNNWVVDSMIVFNDQLYAGTRNDTGGAEIWRTSNGTSWSSVVADQVDGNSTGADENGFNDSNNTRIRKIHNFGDQLYVSVANNSGAEVWTSSNGTSWTQSNTNGFGDNNNDSIGRGAIATFDNQLYTGTYNTNTGAEIWTLADVTNPTITNQSPASNATSVDIDTDISFRTDDEDLGVDSDTIDVTIEGDDVIVNGDCQSGYSCAIGTYGSTGYTVTINPSSNFDYSQEVNITASATDDTGDNTATTSWSFTTEVDISSSEGDTSDTGGVLDERNGTLVDINPKILTSSGPGQTTRLQAYSKGTTDGTRSLLDNDITGLFPDSYLGGAGITPIDYNNNTVLDQFLIFAINNGGPQAKVVGLKEDGSLSSLGQMFVFDSDIRDGLSATSGDFDNDGYNDDAAFCLTGDIAPTVRVYSDVSGIDNWNLLNEFQAPFGNVGCNLGTFQFDNAADEILVTPNHGPAEPKVYIYTIGGTLKKDFWAYDAPINQGISSTGIGERIYTTPNNGSS